jgi:hypothetical protein
VAGVEFLDIEAGADLCEIPFGPRVEKLIGDLELGVRIFA